MISFVGFFFFFFSWTHVLCRSVLLNLQILGNFPYFFLFNFIGGRLSKTYPTRFPFFDMYWYFYGPAHAVCVCQFLVPRAAVYFGITVGSGALRRSTRRRFDSLVHFFSVLSDFCLLLSSVTERGVAISSSVDVSISLPGFASCGVKLCHEAHTHEGLVSLLAGGVLSSSGSTPLPSRDTCFPEVDFV